MTWTFEQVPEWGLRLIYTALTVGGGYLLGHLLNVLVLPRLVALARRTRGDGRNSRRCKAFMPSPRGARGPAPRLPCGRSHSFRGIAE